MMFRERITEFYERTKETFSRVDRKVWVRISLVVALISAAGIVASLSYIGMRELAFAWSGQLFPSEPELFGLDSSGQINLPGSGPGSGWNLGPGGLTVLEPSLTPWDGVGRVTVLLMGLDYRDWAAGTDASRSDTMILLTLDPLTNTGGILSIPRDLWVQIPGFQHGKINTAYYFGEAYQLPGGGPGLAVKTVELLLGVEINFYAQIDFSAFISFIDRIGGVKIYLEEPIEVDPLGRDNKKIIEAGWQTLPGDLTLAYARNRKTSGGDFDRAQRQQQVILAIRDRILEYKLLPTLISDAPEIYQELASGIRTNMTLEDATKLALLAYEVSFENIQRGVIDTDYVIFGRSPDNLSILIPLADKIRLLRDNMFGTSGSLAPLTPGDATERMLAENASIALRNGSSVSDLGMRTGQYLSSLGANIVDIRAAGQTYSRTLIIDHTGRPFAVSYFVEWMGIDLDRIYFQYQPGSAVDVEIYIGDDWYYSNDLP